MTTLLARAGAWLLPLVERAYAQTPPLLPCGNLPGCNGGGLVDANPLEEILPMVALIMIRLAAGGAVIFVIIGGYQMFLSQGDESKISRAKWGVLNSMFGLALAIVSQVLVSTVVSEIAVADVTDETALLVGVRDLLLLAVNGVFLCVIAWAGIRMVMSQGKPDEFTKAKTQVTWAIIGAVVINLAAALVQVVATFFGV